VFFVRYELNLYTHCTITYIIVNSAVFASSSNMYISKYVYMTHTKTLDTRQARSATQDAPRCL
jgi:hypothetical protein